MTAGFGMEELYRALGQNGSFVGTMSEWAAFQRDIGPIAFAPTRDLLELAELIGGCRLFIGNQRCPLAIAEGLKVPFMQAVYAPTPNCIFYRDGHFPIWSATQMPGALRAWETRVWNSGHFPNRFASFLFFVISIAIVIRE